MKNKGFSLVEVVIYSALAVLVLSAIVSSMISLNSSFSVIKADYSANKSAAAIFETLSREIRNSISVNSLTTTTTSTSSFSTLILNSKDPATGQAITLGFTPQNGILYYDKNGQTLGPLNSTSSQLTNFLVKSVSSGNSTGLKIDATFLVVKNKATSTINFSSFYVLRGTY